MFDQAHPPCLASAQEDPAADGPDAGSGNALAAFPRVLDAGLAGVLRDPHRAAGRYARRLQNHTALRAAAPSTKG